MLALRLILAAVLLYAAGGKILAWSASDGATPAADLFGDLRQRMPLAAAGVIGLEILLGVWLIAGWRPKWSGIATAALLAAFTGALAAELKKSTPRACNCLGGSSVVELVPGLDEIRAGLRWGIARNAGLIACAMTLAMLAATSRRPNASQPAHDRPADQPADQPVRQPPAPPAPDAAAGDRKPASAPRPGHAAETA